MYTIHNGISGGWYGSVQADTAADARAMAEELGEVLAALRASRPRPPKAPSNDAPALNAKGAALIAWLDANPAKGAREMWEEAKPTKRTFDWLIAQGFIAWDETRPDPRERLRVLKRA